MGDTFDRIVAAATRVITKKGGKTQSTGNSGEQVIAWDLYECVPEVGTYADWVSNAMSGASLFAGKRAADGTVERMPDGSRAAELVSAMAGGIDGQAELLSGFGTQLAVAGEAWLIIIPEPDAESFADDRWVVLSTEEVKAQRGKIKATVDGEEIEIPEYDPDAPQDPDAPVAIRIWKPSPRRHQEATSAVIRSITVLEELRLLNAAVAAIARSRITGRGVLLVPTGTRFPTAPGQPTQETTGLLDILIEVASTAIREPESAAATVPITLEVPGDLINGVKWLQFGSEFDSLAIQLRDEAIRRFATGADVPAEMLLGMGDVNHWGAWALTAEGLKSGAEPRLALVCHALTNEWLRPLLEADSDPDAAEVMVWYDTAALRSSSNKSASALEGFKEGLVSGKAARRELGFTEDDAPSAEELGTRNPAPAPADDSEDGLNVTDTQAPPVETGAEGAAVRLDVAASAAAHTAALIAAVDGLVHGAMLAAGPKIARTPACPRPERANARDLVATGTVHTAYPVADSDVDAYKLLDGAWVRVPEVAARYGADPLTLTAALDDYTRALLVTGTEHSYDNVVRMLAQQGVIPSALIGMVKR